MTTRSLRLVPKSIDIGECDEPDGSRVLVTGETEANERFYAHLSPECARDLAQRLLSAADAAEGVGHHHPRRQAMSEDDADVGTAKIDAYGDVMVRISNDDNTWVYFTELEARYLLSQLLALGLKPEAEP